MKKAAMAFVIVALVPVSIWAVANEPPVKAPVVSQSPDGSRQVEPVNAPYKLTDEERKKARERLDPVMQETNKQIFITGVENPKDLQSILNAHTPTIKENPERFIPSFIHCCVLVEMIDGKRVPIADAPIRYRGVIKTGNKGEIVIEGTTFTNENGMYAILIPDGIQMKIIFPRCPKNKK